MILVFIYGIKGCMHTLICPYLKKTDWLLMLLQHYLGQYFFYIKIIGLGFINQISNKWLHIICEGFKLNHQNSALDPMVHTS